MKVIEKKTGKLIEVNDSYGERLIQHGMALLPPPAPAHVAPAHVPKGAAKKKDDA